MHTDSISHKARSWCESHCCSGQCGEALVSCLVCLCAWEVPAVYRQGCPLGTRHFFFVFPTKDGRRSWAEYFSPTVVDTQPTQLNRRWLVDHQPVTHIWRSAKVVCDYAGGRRKFFLALRTVLCIVPSTFLSSQSMVYRHDGRPLNFEQRSWLPFTLWRAILRCNYAGCPSQWTSLNFDQRSWLPFTLW